MTYMTHFGSKLAASLSAATYSSSRFRCVMFWSAFVTKDCKQSQSSFELIWKEWSPYSTASSSSRIHIFHLYMAHTSISTTVVYCLQSHSPACQYHSTLSQNEKNVGIQLCHSNTSTFMPNPINMFHISVHYASRLAPWIFSILDICHSISGLCRKIKYYSLPHCFLSESKC